MDKYFDPSYDPRLDVTVDALTDTSSGLIAPMPQWEDMLSIVKARKEERKEKEAREKEARRKEREKIRLERERRRAKRKGGGGGGSDDEWRRLERDSSEDIVVHGPHDASQKVVGMMEMSYPKRGAVRTWDMGKETPT